MQRQTKKSTSPSASTSSVDPFHKYQNLIQSLYQQEKKLTLPVLQNSLKIITECYQQFSMSSLSAETLILHSQISQLFILWFQELIDNHHQSGLQSLLKYVYDLLLCSSAISFSSPSSSSSFFPFSPQYHYNDKIKTYQIPSPFLNHSIVSSLLRLHTIYSNPSGCCMTILKYVTYILKYFIESDPHLSLEEYAPLHQWSLFLEEVILILMKKECSLSMIFNYGRCLNALSHSKSAIQKLIMSSLSRVITAISSMHSVGGLSLQTSSLQCNELESYLILSALSLFYSWTPTCLPSLNLFQLCDQLMTGIDSFSHNSRICLFVCLSIKCALETELLQNEGDGQTLARYCTTRWNLPERLIKIIHDHPQKYRLIVVALECFFLLVSSSSSEQRSLSPSFMITSSTPTPSLVLDHHPTCLSPFPLSSPPLLSSFASTEERISSLVSQWNPFLAAHYRDLRWQRRRSFCLFLVCCCRSSCVYGQWTCRKNRCEQQKCQKLQPEEGHFFPSLDLIFSSIVPMKPRSPPPPITSAALSPLSLLLTQQQPQQHRENVKLIEKIFFSKTLCLQISSFL
jgi:hypothetical protein